MPTVLYARGIEVAEGEEALSTQQDVDEKFMNKVREDLSYGLSFYQDRDDEFARQERWYFRQHYENPVPTSGDTTVNDSQAGSNIESEHVVTLNIPFTSVTRAHTMMTSETPVIESLSKKKASERLNQLLHGVLYTNSLKWGVNPMYDAIFNQLLYGWGVLKVTWQRTPYEDIDGTFRGDRPPYAFPIEVKSIHPSTIYPIPGGTKERWKAVIHRTLQKIYEVEDQWGVTLNHNDHDIMNREEDEELEPLHPEREVEVIDYWCWVGDSIYHAVIAHDQFVLRPSLMKFYDMLPYVIFFCTSTTDETQGEHIGLAANYALIDSVSELEWLANRHMRIIDLYADPDLVVIKVNDESLDIPETPGGRLIELVEGERAFYLGYDGSLPDLPAMETFFRIQIDEEGFGIPSDGVSGLDTIALQQAALIKIFKPIENAEFAWEAMNSRIIGLFQRFSWGTALEIEGRIEKDGNTTAFSFSMKGSESTGMRATKVTLTAKFPLEELRNVAAATTLLNSGLLPKPMIQKKFLHVQDTDAINAKILEEQIENDPTLRAGLIQNNIMLITERSSIQELVAEAADEVLRRGEVSLQGAPESPAPSGLPPTVEESMGEVETQLGAGVSDAGPPQQVPSEQPAQNIATVV